MRIALLHPTFWPEVRRGSERLIHDIAAGLAARGHEPVIITTHPGPGERSLEDGIEVIRMRRPPALRPLRWYEDQIATVPAYAWRVSRGGYDLAHAFFPSSAYAAAIARRRFGGPPFVFSLHGTVVRKYLVERRYRIDQLKAAIAAAEATTVLSESAAEPVRNYLLHDPVVLAAGVVLDDFGVEAERAVPPVIVSAASLRDPRKRGELILEAFELLRSEREVELELIATADPALSANPLPALRDGARWIETPDTPALARAYARASASVLASVDEAFGLVLAESLAAGTPVVAARSGALPEIVDDDAIGRLFEPDDAADLARALGEVIDLATQPGSAERCRAHARRFDIELVLDRLEGLYERARVGS